MDDVCSQVRPGVNVGGRGQSKDRALRSPSFELGTWKDQGRLGPGGKYRQCLRRRECWAALPAADGVQ